MKKAFKFRLYPNQQEQLQFGSACFAYNNVLAFKQELYQKEGRHISKYEH